MKYSLSKFLPALALSLLPAMVHAAYPDRPIKLVVPYAAGGPTDTFARSLAEVWGKTLNTTMIVENKAGAGTLVGTEYVAKSAKDGYTILMATVAHAVNPSINESLTFDPIKDFSPIGLAARAPLVLVVNNTVPATTLSEFFAYLKENGNKVDYGSAGIASAPHLGGALLNYLGNFETKHIPYRGSAPAMADLIGGHVQFMLDSAATGLAQAKAGTVKLLGTSMSERLPQTPDIPAISEEIAGYEAYTWNAMFAPTGVPPEIIEKLTNALGEALNDEELKTKAYDMGLVLEQKPEAKKLEEFVASEINKWRPVVKDSDMKTN